MGQQTLPTRGLEVLAVGQLNGDLEGLEDLEGLVVGRWRLQTGGLEGLGGLEGCWLVHWAVETQGARPLGA